MTGPSLRRLADGLTVLRALLGLPLLLVLQAGWGWLGWLLLLAGALTDAADGWLARRAGGGTAWGARLDPLSDKLLICAPLLLLAADGRLPLWAVWLLLARELLITGWRQDRPGGGPASRVGKLKTVVQLLALLLLLWPGPGQAQVAASGLAAFWLALALALVSAWQYLSPPEGPHRR